MKELIKINGNNTISGRELYDFLQVETPFKKWIDRMIEYGFVEGTDFWTKMSKSTGGRPATEYELTISMAKELSMVQRNERGKQARLYFIECERRLKERQTPELPDFTDPVIAARAWRDNNASN